jgi:hypothetical protein
MSTVEEKALDDRRPVGTTRIYVFDTVGTSEGLFLSLHAVNKSEIKDMLSSRPLFHTVYSLFAGDG